MTGLGKTNLQGPYGTNIGDIWSAEDSPIGKMCMERDNCVMIHEVFANDDGTPEERIYLVKVDNPDMQMQGLIAHAREGSKLWIEAQAKQAAETN
jgi:hypothetical protein